MSWICVGGRIGWAKCLISQYLMLLLQSPAVTCPLVYASQSTLLLPSVLLFADYQVVPNERSEKSTNTSRYWEGGIVSSRPVDGRGAGATESAFADSNQGDVGQRQRCRVGREDSETVWLTTNRLIEQISRTHTSSGQPRGDGWCCDLPGRPPTARCYIAIAMTDCRQLHSFCLSTELVSTDTNTEWTVVWVAMKP